MRAELIVDSRDWPGEGVFWSAAHGLLFWTDIFGQRVNVFDPASGRHSVHPVPGKIGTFSTRRGRPWNEVVAAFSDGFAFVDLLTGIRHDIARTDSDKPGLRMNDGRTDRQGRFVAGGINEAGPERNASVFRLDPDLSVHRLFADVGCANGTCFSPDGATMWFADSSRAKIEAFDYDQDRGWPQGRRTVVDVKGIPDGSCVDAEGYVWNAVWEGYRVDRYAPDGRLDRSIHVPVRKVTCVAFGGADLATLFITTSRDGESEEDLSRQPGAGGLFACSPGVVGLADTPFGG